jgi:ATP/maltotriose-dependent transcriptional regulator MalT/DNA-binding SARP family transcriptional activator
MRDSHHPVTIKTSAPSLDGVIERPRLIDALVALPTAAKWLQAPSGTGKSTLAASYARSRKKPLLWYRLDERDNDPAFFYVEFAQAVRAQLRLTRQLPKFSSDDHERQQEFAQRFAAALSEQLAKPALLVLDDAHRVTNEEMQRALAAIVAVAASGNELLFVSQSAAPVGFFDAISARQLGLLNDADLRFDTDECKAMTASLRVGDAQSESISALTGGHAGALVLACELFRGTDPKSALGVATAERIHSHLLSKLIERMPEQRRELLLQTSFVTQLTRPVAEKLAGIDAARELDPLVESGLLRRVGADESEVFEAHGLVRQGMQALVRARYGEGEVRALAEHTATVLVSNNSREAAFELLTEIKSTLRAIEQLAHLAPRYAAQGQVDLLLASIAKLPAGEVERDPWLCFWTGQALLRVNEEQARVWLGHSYAAFEAVGDSSGMRLAAANVVTAFGLECGDFRDLDLWIERHTRAGGDTPVEANQQFETSLLMGIMCAAFVAGRYPPQIQSDVLVARMRLLLDVEQAWLSDDQRVQAARTLIEHGMVFSSFELARSSVLATRSLVEESKGGALHRGRWLIAAAYSYFQRDDTTECLAYLEEARSLAEQSNSARLSFELGFALSDYWMKARDLQRAADEMQLLEPVAEQAPPAQRAQYARMRARLLLLQERLAEGLRWTEEARRMAVPAGYSGANLRVFDFDLVNALAANDRLADAIDLLRRQEFEPREIRIAVENCLRFLHEGATNVQLLRTGLQAATQSGFTNLFERAPIPLARVCEAALANDIETDFVSSLISLKRLKPPLLAGPHWPWQVHVRTLGGFRLDIGGKRYRPTHKAQDKPLELLKLLVTCEALGRRSAEKMWLAERLWPDAEAENARKSLDMTVGRLRRLLRSDDTVLSIEGRLELSSDLVWTDVQPLLNALSQTRIRHDQHVAGKPSSGSDAATAITGLLQHYSGSYLAGEEGPPWLLAGREAIAAAVRQALVTADLVLDGSADELLIPAIEKALAADPTSEDLARALMRAHLRGGHKSEALRVYRRLREMLSLLLGVAPSKESEHIRNLAYTADPAIEKATSSAAGSQP